MAATSRRTLADCFVRLRGAFHGKFDCIASLDAVVDAAREFSGIVAGAAAAGRRRDLLAILSRALVLAADAAVLRAATLETTVCGLSSDEVVTTPYLASFDGRRFMDKLFGAAATAAAVVVSSTSVCDALLRLVADSAIASAELATRFAKWARVVVLAVGRGRGGGGHGSGGGGGGNGGGDGGGGGGGGGGANAFGEDAEFFERGLAERQCAVFARLQRLVVGDGTTRGGGGCGLGGATARWSSSERRLLCCAVLKELVCPGLASASFLSSRSDRGSVAKDEAPQNIAASQRAFDIWVATTHQSCCGGALEALGLFVLACLNRPNRPVAIDDAPAAGAGSRVAACVGGGAVDECDTFVRALHAALAPHLSSALSRSIEQALWV